MDVPKKEGALWELKDNFLMQIAQQTRTLTARDVDPLRIINYSLLSTVEDEDKRKSILQGHEKSLMASYQPLLSGLKLQRFKDGGDLPDALKAVVQYPRAAFDSVVQYLLDNTQQILQSTHEFSGYLQTELDYETNAEKYLGRSAQWKYNFCRCGLLMGIKHKEGKYYLQAAGVIGLLSNQRDEGQPFPTLQQKSWSGPLHPVL